jgi:hypothetical protein
MNINAGNPSLENIITRTLMGKKEKRPSFQEVFNKLSKNSAMMNPKMPLNTYLTNEQMFRCYVQNTMPKLQKSNDTFGESELNSVLMKLLGNDPSGNALSTTPLATTGGTVPLPATGGASLGTLPLTTATVLPTTATPVSAPITAPTAPITAPTAPITAPTAPTGIPTPPPLPTLAQLAVAPSLTGIPTTPMPSLIPIVTAVTPLMPLTIPIVTAVTPLMPLTIPPMGSVSTPPPSPLLSLGQNIGGAVGGAISSLFSPNPSIQGLVTTPPPAQTQLFPAGTAGAAFTSNPTIPPTADELAAQVLANLQVAATANLPDPSLVINTPGAGRSFEKTNDPEKIEKQNAVALIRKYNKVKRDTLSEDIKNELTKANKIKKDYYEKYPGRKIKEETDEKNFRAKAKEKAVQAAKTKEEREAEEDEASASFGN